MDSVKHEDVTIIDKNDTSNTVCHVVDGFLLEESNEPFPVSPYMFVYTSAGNNAFKRRQYYVRFENSHF